MKTLSAHRKATRQFRAEEFYKEIPMNTKFFTVRAQADGLWLEIKGNSQTAVINLTAYPGSLEYKCAKEVWEELRKTTCARCGEQTNGDSVDGCRDPDCPVPIRGEN